MAGGTYVQLTREEFEEWLNDHGFRGKWKRHDRYGGVYLLDLSDKCAISINSTTGTSSSVKERGRASMKMRLVSKITGKTMLGPPKLMGKSHFKRTLNWRDTWGKGLDRAKQVYNKSRSFYDAIAEIEDRDEYKQEMLALIESKAGWQSNDFLRSLHDKVSGGGVLTSKQKAAIERQRPAQKDPTPAEPAVATPAPVPDSRTEEQLERLRDLYREARKARDNWTLDFTKSIAEVVKNGGSMSTRRKEVLKDKLEQYGLSADMFSSYGIRAALATRIADRWLQ